MPWDVSNFEKHGYFYLDLSSGNGDLLFNTCRVIIETKDNSDWAYRSLIECIDCLDKRKRWPNYMSPMITTTNHTQKQMSRDPYIMAYCCAVWLGVDVYVAIPLHLYRPSVWSWRRYLITGKGKRMYEFWEVLSIKLSFHVRKWKFYRGMPEYARVLSRYMAEAAGSERVINLLNKKK